MIPCSRFASCPTGMAAHDATESNSAKSAPFICSRTGKSQPAVEKEYERYQKTKGERTQSNTRVRCMMSTLLFYFLHTSEASSCRRTASSGSPYPANPSKCLDTSLVCRKDDARLFRLYCTSSSCFSLDASSASPPIRDRCFLDLNNFVNL